MTAPKPDVPAGGVAPIEVEVAALTERVKVLEAELNAVITAFHLMVVSTKPTEDWLDKKLAAIREQSIADRLDVTP